MTEAKRRTLATLGSGLGLVLDDQLLGAQLRQAFGRDAPRLLDVGVGGGAATVAWARDHPDHDVLAVDLHRPSLVAALTAVDAARLTNVRIADLDVRQVLDRAAPFDVDHLRLLFPDPWPKRRHHHRRLVDEAFLGQVADLLPRGGTFHLATDWEGYGHSVRALLAGSTAFTLVEGPAPPRPTTAYERAGREAGRRVIDLVAVRG